jgi:hypothetical protein
MAVKHGLDAIVHKLPPAAPRPARAGKEADNWAEKRAHKRDENFGGQ